MPARAYLGDLVSLWIDIQDDRTRLSTTTRHALNVLCGIGKDVHTAKQLYDTLHHSPSDVKRHVRRDVGISVARFIRYWRIVEVFRLMVGQPERQVELLSDELGYSAPTTMIRTWRREVGLTPGKVKGVLARCPQRFGSDGEGLLRAAVFVDRSLRGPSACRPASLPQFHVVLFQQPVQRFQIGVCCDDHPDVSDLPRSATHRANKPVVQELQQLGLDVQGRGADLVQ